ncbi:MAG: DUF6475 domain-containing protein [Myxococcota bacterium]
MVEADRKPFGDLLPQVMAYHGAACSAFTIGVFWEALKGYDLNDIRRAFSLHAQDPEKGVFSPKVADIVRILEGTGSDRAAIAWAKVISAVKHVGNYQTVAFDDPLIHAALHEIGGYARLCDERTENMPHREREFAQRYRAYAARRTVPPYPAKFIGEVEAHNSAKGLTEFVPAPVLVGDATRALAVIAGGQAAAITQLTPMSALVGKVEARAVTSQEKAA